MTGEDPASAASLAARQDGLEHFAALAAHQLGEAIALMRGAAVVLEQQAGVNLGPGGQDALRALNAGGDRAQRYVDDLLDIVRATGEPEDPGTSDLDAAFDAAAADLRVFLDRVPVHVQREPLPRVALPERDAQRIFTHLLRSALSAGASRLGVTGRVEAGDAIVDLYDNGTPVREVDPSTHPFEPFARPRGRGPLVGAGVSLPLSRRLVERAGGRIAMEVRDDGATIVTVELPAADADADVDAVPAAPAGGP
ncbi:MAG TPA: HAMP domain-containing sensor histidine kinase [Baekduia sp.]|uniref:HAMP domain-containing sensor histidine kinase n=1 Tax=Baekduia sp. TaxID=2600305 RepID=UPI002D764AE5|nr:HAMP domain-containing sensor histidine kinase [Baekduia sp.]HET6508258.1 HAMP domain-containing sensor histidine kinase [Baekduia sp.]